MSKLEFVTAKEFRERIKENATDNIGIRKNFTIAKMDDLSTNASQRLKFAITTPDIDRDNDTIRVEGWDFEDYKKNPVVLWGHDYYQPPVAKALSIYNAGHQIESEAEFTSKDLYEFGHMVYRMLKEKFLNAVSVGFLPTEYNLANDREHGLNITRQSLLEYSVVPVPSNPNALIQARGKGIDIAPMYEWAEKILDSWDDDGKKLLIPKAEIELLRKQADEKQSVWIPAKSQKGSEMKKSAISYGQAHPGGTPLSPKDTDWNGPEQISAATVDDLKVMCAWVDSENSENKTAYKLPHHMAAGQHAAVWRGITAAMGALLGARGGVNIPESDRRGVYNHLAEHYAEYEETPPEFKYVEAQVLKHLEEDFIYENGKLERATEERKKEIQREKVKSNLLKSVSDIEDEEIKTAVENAIAAFEKSFDTENGSADDVFVVADDPSVKDVINVDDNLLNELKETARDVIRKAQGKLD